MHDEQRLAELCAAILVNRCVISMSVVVTRITFLEGFGPGVVEPRTAICMNTSDAVELYKALGNLIAQLPPLGKVH